MYFDIKKARVYSEGHYKEEEGWSWYACLNKAILMSEMGNWVNS